MAAEDKAAHTEQLLQRAREKAESSERRALHKERMAAEAEATATALREELKQASKSVEELKRDVRNQAQTLREQELAAEDGKEKLREQISASQAERENLKRELAREKEALGAMTAKADRAASLEEQLQELEAVHRSRENSARSTRSELEQAALSVRAALADPRAAVGAPLPSDVCVGFWDTGLETLSAASLGACGQGRAN